MPHVSMIVAIANNNVIGRDMNMPWYLPADLAYFKMVTTGKPVIMGRKTYESIGHPLPDRTNIVLSSNRDLEIPGVAVVHSVAEALNLFPQHDEVMVIGGGWVYSQFIDHAELLYITHIEAEVEGNVKFPSIDESNWVKIGSDVHKPDEKNEYEMDFCLYSRVK